jgi:hypothetical protein
VNGGIEEAGPVASSCVAALRRYAPSTRDRPRRPGEGLQKSEDAQRELREKGLS